MENNMFCQHEGVNGKCMLDAAPDSKFCSLHQTEAIHHPAHYTHGAIEAIQVIEDWRLGYNLGCVIKYICRLDHKGDRLDNLRKAQWYIDREINAEAKRKGRTT